MEQSSEQNAKISLTGELLDGRYELLEEIGHGGMSTIFKAHDRMMGRDVAVKLVALGLQNDETQRERFNREIKALSILEHENLVKIFSAGIDGDARLYFSMELLCGLTLEQLFNRLEKLDSDAFYRVFIPVLHGIEYAHGKQIVHRDLKPSNIFLCQDSSETRGNSDERETICRLLESLQGSSSRVKLLDFGIAKFYTGEKQVQLTAELSLLGTPEYMSPEQAAGKTVDFRSDIYSLACIMYQAITGSPPFQGDTALETMYAHLRSNIPTIKELTGARNYSKDLVDVIIAALDKDPERRPQTAAEFEQRIKQAFLSRNRVAAKSDRRAPAAVALALLILIPASTIIIGNSLKRINKEKYESIVSENRKQDKKHDIDQKSGLTLFDLALRAEIKGDAKAAKQYFLDAIEKMPDSMRSKKRLVYFRFALLNGTMSEPDAQARNFEKALSFADEDEPQFKTEVYTCQMNSYLLQNKKKEAGKAAREILAIADSGKMDNLSTAGTYEAYAAYSQAIGDNVAALKYARKTLELLESDETRTNLSAIKCSWIVFDELSRLHQARNMRIAELKKTYYAIKNSQNEDCASLFGDFGEYAVARGFSELGKRCYLEGMEKVHFASPGRSKRYQQQLEGRLDALKTMTSNLDIPELK